MNEEMESGMITRRTALKMSGLSGVLGIGAGAGITYGVGSLAGTSSPEGEEKSAGVWVDGLQWGGVFDPRDYVINQNLFDNSEVVVFNRVAGETYVDLRNSHETPPFLIPPLQLKTFGEEEIAVEDGHASDIESIVVITFPYDDPRSVEVVVDDFLEAHDEWDYPAIWVGAIYGNLSVRVGGYT